MTDAPFPRPDAGRAGKRATLWSVWGWFVFGAACIVLLPVMAVVRLVTAPFDKGRYWTGYIFRQVPVIQQKLLPLWTFHVTGEMPADPRHPYIAVANHESFVDILLISHLPWEMKWLSKEQLFSLPIAGWMMRLAGDIEVVRGNKDSAKNAMAECAVWLDRNVSVMIFPEGTRVEDEGLAPFKDGAFRLAIETGVPLLPMVVTGTKTAMRKGDWRFRRADATVKVLPPVPVEGLTLNDVDELRERVRGLMGDALEDLIQGR